MSSSNFTLSTAMAVLSINSSNEPIGLLNNLPNEIIIGIAKYLDHKSLVLGLGATCSCFQQIALKDVDNHWKVLHDQHWHSGKVLYFNGPPSQRPRNGIGSVDDGRNWREEFIRRVELDKTVPEILSRLVAHGHAGLQSVVNQHGADIYDSARLMARDPLLGEAAQKVLVAINVVQARNDWLGLHSEPALSSAGFDDGMMMLSKLFQSREDLIRRKSPNEIYDEINRTLDVMTKEELGGFEIIGFGEEDDDARAQQQLDAGFDAILLDKVLENRKGTMMSIASISPRVLKSSAVVLARSELEMWYVMRGCLFEQILHNNDERIHEPLLLYAVIECDVGVEDTGGGTE